MTDDEYQEGLRLLGLPVKAEGAVQPAPMTAEFAKLIEVAWSQILAEIEASGKA